MHYIYRIEVIPVPELKSSGKPDVIPVLPADCSDFEIVNVTHAVTPQEIPGTGGKETTERHVLIYTLHKPKP